MGQLVDLHARVSDLLELIRAAYAATGTLRIFDPPPVALPEMPCIYVVAIDEEPGYGNVDTVMGQSIATVTVRICVEATRPMSTLLELADAVIETTDVWLRVDPPEPIDQARRQTARTITPVFDGVPTRGADLTIRAELNFRQTHPAP